MDKNDIVSIDAKAYSDDGLIVEWLGTWGELVHSAGESQEYIDDISRVLDLGAAFYDGGVVVQTIKGTILESVGTYLTEGGMAYPINADGSLDYPNGSPLLEIEPDGDWFKGLSVNDQTTVNEMLTEGAK